MIRIRARKPWASDHLEHFRAMHRMSMESLAEAIDQEFPPVRGRTLLDDARRAMLGMLYATGAAMCLPGFSTCEIPLEWRIALAPDVCDDEGVWS